MGTNEVTRHMGPLLPPKKDEVICMRGPCALPPKESDLVWSNPVPLLITSWSHPPSYKNLPSCATVAQFMNQL